MIKLIVGLGNPGDRYQKTRHNAGFWLLDQLVASEHSRLAEDKKFQSEYGKIFLANHPLHLLKPLTFMNASGRAVSAAAKFYDIAPEEILVVHDELDLPEGAVKLKYGGGHGGHNGLRDIIAALGSKDFYRLRIGINHPGDRNQVVDYVLHPPGKAEQAQIDTAITRGLNILPILLQGGAEKAMHRLHSTE
ncbi:aminoacyl-tRNA hydrolase [Cardiobacterium sp. Marseille-Q4385]|jgi:aminoacyl-tRNA hydrolase|uniref:aminoacyl-tRNA hydrolase n=1 Tax=Cardiobacterium sp. Marseille-Q4385 TaxID=2866573 RepID=UPI001CE3C8DA|nr:aminoacyl-tRNA hydrolase [Cardiobacterium sp. Marseille-Q4385]